MEAVKKEKTSPKVGHKCINEIFFVVIMEYLLKSFEILQYFLKVTSF